MLRIVDQLTPILHNAGRITARPPIEQELGRFPLTFYKLFSLQEGTLTVECPAGRTVFRPGEAGLLQPGLGYRLHSRHLVDIRQACFDLRPQPLKGRSLGARMHRNEKRCQARLQDLLGLAVPVKLPHELCDRVRKELASIKATYWIDHAHLLSANSRLGLLLGDLLIQISTCATPSDHDDPVTMAETLVRTYRPMTLTVRDLAEHVGMTREHFTRIYRRRRDYPPGRFLADERMRVAHDMVVSRPELSIATIARDVGFSSSANFARAFRNHFDIAPSELR